jgi:hypothetical protein
VKNHGRGVSGSEWQMGPMRREKIPGPQLAPKGPVSGGWFGPEEEEFSPCITEGEKDEWAKGLEFGPCEHWWVFSLFYL